MNSANKKTAAIVIRQLEKNTGASRNALEQARMLIGQGYKVDLIGQYIKKDRVAESGINFIVVRTWFKKGYQRRISFERKVDRILKNRNYDLVFGHGDNFSQDVLFPHNCVHLASELVHGKDLADDDSVGRIHSELFTKGSYKLVVANSFLMKRDLIDRFQISEKLIEVVHPGFSPKQFDLSQKSAWREEKRKELGLAPETVLVGLVTSGAFDKRNVKLFIEAISNIDPVLIGKCHFVIVGKDAHESDYKNLGDSLNIKNLEFLGMVSDVEKIYAALDFSVLPAKWEEFGRVVVEAMGLGLPVVCSDRVGASEIFESESRNLIFQSNNAEELKSRMEDLIKSAELREKVSALNLSTSRKYSEQTQSEKLLKILNENNFL